jgi:hypothetical protein
VIRLTGNKREGKGVGHFIADFGRVNGFRAWLGNTSKVWGIFRVSGGGIVAWNAGKKIRKNGDFGAFFSKKARIRCSRLDLGRGL